MTKISFLFIGIFGISIPVLAVSPPPYCTDLFSVACAPGDTKDLTGTAKADVSQFFLDSTIQQDLPMATDDFKKILQDPNQKYFRKMALQVLNFKNSPECQFQDAKNTEECNSKVAKGLAQFAGVKITSHGGAKVQTNGSLEDMMLLQENSNFRKVSLGMKKRISEKLKVKDLEKKVQNDLFPEAKARLEAKVSALPISDKMKEYLASKIRSMQYVGGDCMQAERGYSKISIDFDLVNSAAYMEGRNDFFICNGLALAGQSDFNLLFTIAHELAHGLGPCGVQYAVSEEKIKYDQKNLDTAESQYMFSSLLKCLRNKDSIAAKRDEGMFSAAWRRIFGTSDRMFCSGDQIGESIADWFATEVMADHISKNYPNMKPDDALKAISNILKPLCSTSPGPELQKEFESHPQWKDRINRIILAQPKIRQTLGCSQVQAPAGYCDGSSSQPVKSISGRISPGSSGGATR